MTEAGNSGCHPVTITGLHVPEFLRAHDSDLLVCAFPSWSTRSSSSVQHARTVKQADGVRAPRSDQPGGLSTWEASRR